MVIINHQPSAQRVNIDNDKGLNQVHKTSSEDDFRGSLQQVEFESIPKRRFLDLQPSAQRVTSDDAEDSQIGHQLDQADEDSSDDYISPLSTGSQSTSEAQSPKQGGDCSDEEYDQDCGEEYQSPAIRHPDRPKAIYKNYKKECLSESGLKRY